MQTNKQSVRIALDGPSALLLYRDRSECIKRPKRKETTPVYDDDSQEFWLSDEDVAATLSETSVFGRSSDFTAFEQPSDTFLPSLRPSQMRYLLQCSSRARDIGTLSLDSFGVQPPTQTSPLYLLVASPRKKWLIDNVHLRSCVTGFPRGSFYCMDKTIYVPRPELAFLLMAHHLSFIDLVQLGMELCGHYRLMGGSSRHPLISSRTIYGQQTITSEANLARYLERAQGITGIKNARRALGYLANDSASPMESVVYLLLCLPRSLGGYAIRRPILNAKRAVHMSAKSFTLADHLIPDLYWPEYRLDVEYDSDEFHPDDDSLVVAGARRTLALRTMNVEVLSLTYDVVADPMAFESFARMVAKKLNQRWYRPTEREKVARERLRANLLRGQAWAV